jgi:outer membrane protein assembly factor BamB
MKPSDMPAIETRWVTDCDMVMQGSAIAADIDGDGNTEFLTAAYQAIIAVDAKGTELWRFTTKCRFMACPAVLERPGESALIYAGDMTNAQSTFYCIDGTGELVWQAEMGQVFWSSPALADINDDGRIEVVQGDDQGNVYVFDALTGDAIWETTIDGECGSVALADINGDGMLEVIVTTSTAKMYVLSATGEILNDITLGGTIFDPVGEYAAYSICAPVVFANSHGQVRIATSVQEPGSLRLVCLDTDCNVIWEHLTDGGVASTISVADFNGDGRVDIFATTQHGSLYRWDEDGSLLWDIDTQGFCYGPGAILDVDGDGELEYVLITELGAIHVFNQDGELVFNHQLDSRRAHRSTPAFGKMAKGDLVFAVTGGDTGKMYCFDVLAPADTQIEWSAFRGDTRATGTWLGLADRDEFRMIPENLVWDRILTTDEITFRVTIPAPDETPLSAEASAVAPDGTRYGAVGVIAGASGVLKMPVTVTSPGMYHFEWAVKDESGTVLTNGARDLTMTPFVNDQALVRRSVIALIGALPEAPTDTSEGIHALLDHERQAIVQEAAKLSSLQMAVPGADAEFTKKVIARTEDLTTRAKRASVLAGIAPDLLVDTPDACIVPFEGRTWENRDVDAEMPTGVSIPLQISRRCVTGEHEPVSIKLLNVTLNEAVVLTSVETTSSDLVVRPHEVKSVPTNPDQDTTAWDPLVVLEDGDSVDIPSFETREIWLDIDTATASAGSHDVSVTFHTETAEMHVEITIEILPFEMAGFDSMRLCLWASYTQDAVRDLLSHGNTVFVTGVPSAVVPEGPTPIEIDFDALDEFIEPMAGHDVFLLMSGVPELGIEWEDDEYTPRLAGYLNKLFAHLTEKGIPKENIALYPWDEVGGHGWDAVRRFVAFGRKAIEAHPGLKIYVNGGGDLPMFEKLVEVAAIWSPAFFMLDDKTPIMDFLRSSDAALWTYNCSYMYARPLGWNTKAMNIVGEFRMQGPFAANYGATGMGYWCYNAGDSMWDAVHPEYPIVYQAEPGGPITSSRRWEAVRESIEDTRILVALRDRLTDDTTSDAAKKHIRHLVEVTLPAMADKSLAEMHLGTARYVLDDTNDDAMVETFRSELLDCVEAVIEG